jgi:hypothetical protein
MEQTVSMPMPTGGVTSPIIRLRIITTSKCTGSFGRTIKDQRPVLRGIYRQPRRDGRRTATVWEGRPRRLTRPTEISDFEIGSGGQRKTASTEIESLSFIWETFLFK